MGTRGAWGFYKDGKHKVQYNQFDTYPEGLGEQVRRFCADHTVEELNQLCDGIELVGEAPPTPEQVDKCKKAKVVDLGVSNQSLSDWYCLLRKTQYDPELTCKVDFIKDSESFLGDSLFCEYAYLINLDEETLEVYTGFQKSKPEGRYSELPNDDGYYAVGLVNTYKLNDLPGDTRDFVPDEDEGDED